MMTTFITSLGVFVYPQVLVSISIVALCLGYTISWCRGELLHRKDHPWVRTLVPLGQISVTIGLLGSVASFIIAFSEFDGGFNIQKVTQALSMGYASTLFGIGSMLLASLCCYVLELQVRGTTL